MSTDLDIIKQLEQKIGKKLEKLDEIKWDSVGYVLDQQKKIVELSLFNCGLERLPLEITKLQNLTKLDLGKNQLINLPPEIVKLEKLTTINLFYNKLTNLPFVISKLQNLSNLYLGYNGLTSLPSEIGKLQNLTGLYLSQNKLTSLPSEISQLQNLTELNLFENQLIILSTKINKLRNLTMLDLSKNKLTNLPSEIGQLQNLIELHLGCNQLTSLPSEIAQLQNLTTLGLGKNQLTNLPSEIAQLQNLTWLNLGNNKLTQFPKSLLDLNLEVKWDRWKEGIYIKNNPFQIPPVEIVKQGKQAIIDYYNLLRSPDLEIIKQLEQKISDKLKKIYFVNQQGDVIKLDLSSCNLREFPSEIIKLQNLTRLDLGVNELTSLPPKIGQLQNLTELNLGINQLTSLPPEIGQLQNLTELNLGWNQLTSLPPEIGQLQNLTVFYLNNTRLTNLPSEIEQLQNLTEFHLFENQLTSLPSEIGQLQNLTELDLNENQLTNLPPEIAQLQNLTHLDLRYNQLTSLPPEIGRLKNLIQLGLGSNQLTSLPLEINQLQNLTNLNLDSNKLVQFPKVLLDLNLEIDWDEYYDICVEDNPFQIPPVEIVKQGRQAIIDYYDSLEQKDRPLNESKLILIGDGGAGKTSLMKRLLGQKFDPQESQTHGININALNLKHNDNDIKLHCWDFGGQQIMHATHQFFLSKRSLYLLVLDSRRETQVNYWLKHIQTFGENAPVIIVINKIDENAHFDIPKRKLKQQYSNIKHIARISCKNETGIDDLKKQIENTLPDIELLNTLFPTTWFEVKTAITERAKQTNFTSYEQFVELCENNGIHKESEQNTLINFLHDLGIVIHFQDRWLRETNVINPQWITEAVYTLINAPQLAGSGKLHRDHFTTLLDNTIYPSRKHDYIIELMKKFELCYPLNGHEYLLPDLFPTNEPDFEFDDNHALHFILDYDFLPNAIFTRFIVRMHQDIENNIYWRNGCLLHNAIYNCKALIETDQQNRITFQITGQQRREYLAVMQFILNDIHNSFNHLNVIPKIGLPDNPDITVNQAYLQQLAANGQTDYMPPEMPDKIYKVSDLLGMVYNNNLSEVQINQMFQSIMNKMQSLGLKQDELLEKSEDIIEINPGFMGVSVNLREAWRQWVK